MKKRIISLLIIIALAIPMTYAGATSEAVDTDVVVEEQIVDATEGEVSADEAAGEDVAEPEQTVEEEIKPTGFEIQINGVPIGESSVIRGIKHYVPLRVVFEKMGARVFYRTRDRQVYTLSRDGDVIQHIVGSSVATINGVQKSFSYSSFIENGVTYIPIDMIATIFRTNDIFHDHNTKQLKIGKQFSNSDYTKLVKDVLDVSKTSNFYPERFKRYINYYAKNPASTMQNVLFMVNLGLDFPFFENVTTISNPYSLLVLVNKYNKLPAGFAQKNLVNMDAKYTISDGKKYLMQSEAYQKFVLMADAAKKDGLSLRAVSTYRTEDYQARLYNNRLNSTGRTNADNYTARPGFSEHQTGLAVDINSTGASFERTSEFKWLQNHAHEYGYILRYPKDKKWITGYAYESWHYRYVGVEAATIIHREGITYEQYYAKYIDRSEFK